MGDEVGVAIAVDDRDHREAQLARLQDRDVFLIGVDDHEHVRYAAHVADAAERQLQLVAAPDQLQQLLLGQAGGLVGKRLLVIGERLDRAGYGLPVRQHPAQPAVVDVVLAAAPRGLGDRLRRLALGADEEDAPAPGGGGAERHERLVEQRHGLLQIDDVDAVPHAEEIGAHLRIPASRLMPEMHAGFEKLAHGELWQSHWPSFLRFFLRGLRPGHAGHRIGTLSGAVFRV